MKSVNLALILLVLFAICSGVSAKLSYWPSSQSSYYSKTHQFFKTFKSNVDIEDCGDETFVFKLDKITLTPDILKPGAEVTIDASGYLKTTVEEGAYADVVVKLGLIKLLHKRFDICEELRKNKNELQCPFEEGTFTMSQKVTLPKEIPPAKFMVHAQAYTIEEEDLACLKIRADFANHRPPGGTSLSDKAASLSQY